MPSQTLRCPCGVPAPPELPPPGTAPVRCTTCGTPLVRPGRVPTTSVERGYGAALLAAVLCAAGWMAVVRLTGSGAHVLLAVAGVVIGCVTRAAAGARGARLQAAAGIAFAACLALGEVLIYRAAMLPRLVMLHRGESAGDAEALALTELDRMDLERFVHIELRLGLFVGAAVGLGLALYLTRAPMAVAAFSSGPPQDSEAPGDSEGAEDAEATPAAEGDASRAADDTPETGLDGATDGATDGEPRTRHDAEAPEAP